jgi:hypothetical protein
LSFNKHENDVKKTEEKETVSIVKRKLSQDIDVKNSPTKVLDCSFYITEQTYLDCEKPAAAIKTLDSPKLSERPGCVTSTCLICCDSVSDAVLMDCGHGGLCFQCGIALCTNTYEKNMRIIRKNLERSQNNSRSNL